MILCGGDALIDFVPADVAGEAAFVPRVGGAVLNAATALARLGEDVAFIGAASTDLFGDKLVAHMAREGIDHARVARTNDDSTLAFVTLDGGEARYAFYDRTSAGRHWAGADAPEAEALHIGSVTLISEPSAGAYEALAQQMAGRAVISVDPNCRPGLIADPGAYRARMERLAGLSQIVRYSDEDFAYLFGAADEGAVAARLLGGAARLVLISRGAAGATAYVDAGRVDVPARAVAVRDTIGAGDTFHAAVLAWLSQHGKFADAALSLEAARGLLEFASAAAALSCTRDGCDPPGRAEVEAFVLETGT